MSDLYLELWYNIKTDMFGVNTDIKPEAQNEIVSAFLSTQMGRGRDDRELYIRDVYNIKIEVNLSEDIFNLSDDCGNKGLREGILMQFLKRCA